MAYDHKTELIRTRLLQVVGSTGAGLTMPDLWDQYLTLVGSPSSVGTILDRQVRQAALAGVSLSRYQNSTTQLLGPEMAPVVGVDTGSYALTGTGAPTHDGTGIHFVGSSGNSAATWAAGAGVLVNDVTYRMEYTLANYSGAGVGRVLVYADSVNHLASTSAAGVVGNANGNYVAYRATSFTGGNLREIRVQCQTGLCTFDVTYVSVRRVY